MSSLPAHNAFLRGVYIISVLIMFIFMMSLIRAYWPKDAGEASFESMEAFSVAPAKNSEVTAEVLPVVDRLDTEGVEVLHRSEKTLMGIPFVINLSGDVRAQIHQVWRAFYNADNVSLIQGIKNRRKVYVGFTEYDSGKNTVDLLIGYSVDHRIVQQVQGFSVVTIPGGKYLQRDSVLDEWQKPVSTEFPLAYQHDYEVYDLGQEFSIINQTAYVRIAQQ
ncbi:hypothetical protein A9Q99_06510 [Gammaproteobacteria bacterium 45_16_T64]|nr:hypothetical protein A9Q99_06510 [Gammaproteobacteria bacterium 45_16_T64]